MSEDIEGPGAVAIVTTRRRPGGLGFHVLAKARHPKKSKKSKKGNKRK